MNNSEHFAFDGELMVESTALDLTDDHRHTRSQVDAKHDIWD